MRGSTTRSIFLSWLLVAVFLCQPVLTYLVTPTTVHTQDGFRAVVCTLRGAQKDVFIDLPAIDAARKADGDCPAVKLVQLAGTACTPELPEPPSRVLYSVGMLDQTVGHAHHRIHFSAYSSRAPPLA